MIPRIIALCGNPRAGKSNCAKALASLNYELVDDGGPLRHIAMDYFGLTKRNCYTHAGKNQIVTVNGKQYEAREVLGLIGNAFEDKFGGNIICEMATNGLDLNKNYVFGSVRRNQGVFYRQRGGFILEVVNPLAKESKYEFDQFNKDIVHAKIFNDATFRGLSEVEEISYLEEVLKIEIDKFGAGYYGES